MINRIPINHAYDIERGVVGVRFADEISRQLLTKSGGQRFAHTYSCITYATYSKGAEIFDCSKRSSAQWLHAYKNHSGLPCAPCTFIPQSAD